MFKLVSFKLYLKAFLVPLFLYAAFLFPLPVSFRSFSGHDSMTSRVTPDYKDTLITTRVPEAAGISVGSGVTVFKHQLYCGQPEACSPGTFSVHLSTGYESSQRPVVCIDGNHLINPKVSHRGLNMVVIDGVSKTITKMANYDTYQHDSATLEHDLLMLRDGDIVILVSHDEPATKLSSTARLLLHELGSGKSQNIFYRSSYYFVSQKSIQGYTPFEGLSLPVSGGWGPALKLEACIPYQIDGIPVQVDETIDENDDRRKFCDIYGDTWELFCEPSVVNDPLIIAMVPKSQPLSAVIEKTPLVVFTQGLSRILPLTLETIIRQPGINPKNVIVFYNESVSSLMTPLLDLFGFMAESYEDNDKINSAIDTVKLLFPDSEQFILIENDVILSPDFLSFMSQLTRALQYPGSDLIGISAFNEDSRSDHAGNEATIMRTDSSKSRPRMAAMFKSTATVKFSSAKWSFSDDAISGAILIPQVSRVLYLPQASPEPLSDSESTFLSAYLHTDSSVAQSDSVLLQVTDQLVCAAK